MANYSVRFLRWIDRQKHAIAEHDLQAFDRAILIPSASCAPPTPIAPIISPSTTMGRPPEIGRLYSSCLSSIARQEKNRDLRIAKTSSTESGGRPAIRSERPARFYL